MAIVNTAAAYTPDHYTPEWVVELFREVVGGFDLDPGSCSRAQELVGAVRYYSYRDRGEDGTKLPWDGVVFCNPPNNRRGDLVQAFWKRAVGHARSGGTVCWVGFALDQLATLQRVASPLNWPTVILEKRLRFDTLAVPGSKTSIWADAVESVVTLPKVEREAERQKLVAASLARPDLVRIPGKSPTSHNFLTLMGGTDEQVKRFYVAAAGYGTLI
jgi:hypothetical protein